MTDAEILRTLIAGYPIAAEMVDPRYPAGLQQIGGLTFSLMVTMLSLLLGTPAAIALAISRNPFSFGTYSIKPQCGTFGACGGPYPPLTHKVRLPFSYLATGFIEIIQSLPILLLVLLAYYLPYPLLGLRLPPALVAVGVFTIYNAVYLAGIIESGMNAVQPGLLEAARTLGLTPTQILRSIHLPIAFRAMLPAIVGQSVTVFKDTSLLAVTAIGELTYSARQIQMSEPINYPRILLMVLFLYWLIAASGSLLVTWLEKRWNCRNNIHTSPGGNSAAIL